ncbi:MAG: hypothetical protein ABIW33_03955 [Sphingomicrobium sp.]
MRLSSWDEVAAFALALPGTVASAYYGNPAIKVAANGRPFVNVKDGVDSFVLHIDRATKDMLIETDPATFWQTPHFAGWPGLLVRYASDDPDRVADMIARAREQAVAKKPAAKRSTR